MNMRAIPSAWLQERLSLSDVDSDQAPALSSAISLLDELLSLETDCRHALFAAKTLRSRMMEGDELWTYRDIAGSHGFVHGEGGVALVRDGEVIDTVPMFIME